MRLALALFALLPAVGLSVAQAQMPPPDDRNIEVQLFEPALGTHSYLTVTGAEVMSKGQFQIGLGVHYMTHPFSVYLVDDNDNLKRRSDVVSSVFEGNLSFAYGITPELQAGVVLPVILSMQGDGLDASTGMSEPGGLSVHGLGDARIEAVWRFYDKDRLVFAAVPALTVPTSTKLGSDDDGFLGDNTPTFRPKVAAQWTAPDGSFSAGANLGLILRKPRTVYSSEVGQQLTYAVAGAFAISRRLDILAEVFGRNGFGAALDASPLEGDVALRLLASNALSVMLGGGGGIVQGVGAPTVRLFASVSWSPDFRDSDGDRIANMDDKCPTQPEDRDGFQDDDGCPDPDNDGDGVPDDQDKCPMAKEDMDGFQDEDGCPDDDNDKDGIPDDRDGCPEEPEDKLPPRADDGCPQSKGDNDGDGVSDDKDKCPTEFEDMDGFQDDDGCPDPDNDGDGIADGDDKCPTQAEDKDGFQDDDGCPDPDDDNDGVADAKDKCPKQAEVWNGVKDEDGCADSAPKAAASMQGWKIAAKKPLAFDKGRPKSTSYPALDLIGQIMKGRSDVGKWKVTVSGKMPLAQERADAVKAFLVGKGVKADKIEAAGAEGAEGATSVTATAKADGTPIEGEAPGAEPVIEIEPQ